MIEHYDHYRESAEAFSVTWFRRHNTGQLVETLCRADEVDGPGDPHGVPSPHFAKAGSLEEARSW